MSPVDDGWGFSPALQALIGIHPLICDGGDFSSVLQDAGNKLATNNREIEFGLIVIEGILFTGKERYVCVHT